MKAFIEQIEKGHREIKLVFGYKLNETPDILDISNGKPYLWIFNLFTEYKQLGQFKVKRPHDFKEREWIEIEVENGKIISVRK